MMIKIKMFEEYKEKNKDFLTKLVNCEDFQEGDYWQSILTTAFSYWENDIKSYSDMVYNIKDVCSYNSDLMTLSVLIGKYNQQVGNGGHLQYYFNGYASEGGRNYLNNDADIGLHGYMIELFVQFELDKKLNTGKAVLDVIEKFDIELDNDEYVECEDCSGGKEECRECNGEGVIECGECNGEGEIEDDDGDMINCPECNGEGVIECGECNGEGMVDCEYCGGDGEVYNDNKGEIVNDYLLDELDSRWYEIKNFEEDFGEYIKNEFMKPEFQQKVIDENTENVLKLYNSNILDKNIESKYIHIIESGELGIV
jgi:hypothetical protein